MNTTPKFSALGEIDESPDQFRGIALSTLKAYDMIHAQTCNSEYQIFIFDPQSGRALVQGGPYAAKPVAAIVSGSILGDGLFREGWIGIGLCLEMHIHGRRLVTTPVQSLSVSCDY